MYFFISRSLCVASLTSTRALQEVEKQFALVERHIGRIRTLSMLQDSDIVIMWYISPHMTLFRAHIMYADIDTNPLVGPLAANETWDSRASICSARSVGFRTRDIASTTPRSDTEL